MCGFPVRVPWVDREWCFADFFYGDGDGDGDGGFFRVYVYNEGEVDIVLAGGDGD